MFGCAPSGKRWWGAIRFLSLAFCAAWLAAGCVSQAKLNQLDDEDDIREAVIHRLINEASSTIKPTAAAYFVAFGTHDDDPSMDFMTRLQGNLPPVYRFSRCKVTAGKGVVDRISGEEGILFSIVDIHWITPEEVTVSAAYYESMVNSAQLTYKLKKSDQGWKVEMPR